ncbi:MAG: hypothetical protein R3325_03880 [Thermoanaerobaculia bacterium]|nr:hypothetical protein [Thermoanaerobaculia bacterium]
MLRWLVGLIALAIIAYFVINEVLPALRPSGSGETGSEVGARSTESTAEVAQLCVEAVGGAYETVAAELRALGPPPVDSAAWSAAFLDLGRALSRAERGCSSGCFSSSCQRGREALDELRGAVALYDGMIRMDAAGNPATYLERAAGLLSEARSLAASGR